MTAIKNVKLTYFAARGKGELVRYLLHFAKVPFIDERVTLVTWPQLKQTMPLAQMPVLEFDFADGGARGRQLMVQSGAIVRSLARWLGVEGQTPEEIALADQVFESLRDINDAAGKATWENDPAKKEAIVNTIKTETIPRIMTFLEKTIAKNGSKYIAGGNSFTYADFALAVTLENICKDITVMQKVAQRSRFIEMAEIEQKYPNLAAVKKRVEEQPNIAAYLAQRPQTPF